MGIVTYGQGGYVGCSMSVNAWLAYEDGEKPKSKWTKKAMLEAIDRFADDCNVVLTADLRKMRKADHSKACLAEDAFRRLLLPLPGDFPEARPKRQ